MHSFIEYVRRNIMFVGILTAIILVTAGLVIYQMVLAAPTQGGHAGAGRYASERGAGQQRDGHRRFQRAHVER